MKKKPPEATVILVLDENLAGDELKEALEEKAREQGADVVLITERFARGTLDEVWLPVAAEERWAVITCDVHVKKRPAEKTILMKAGACVYILRGVLNGDAIREALVAAIPGICRAHRRLAPPVICHVSRTGEVTVKEGQRRGGVKR
jgi:acetylornithine deacetylase/succinyl-diaminopimelate desuccinylase-like protein